MEERRIGYCGPGGWTMAIGVIQTIESLLWMTGGIFIPIIIQVRGNITKEDSHAFRVEFKSQRLWVVAALVFYILKFYMGLVLLRGSYMRNPTYLQAWMIHAVMSTVVYAVFKIIELFLSTGYALGIYVPKLYIFGGFVVSLVLHLLSIVVVHVHKQEMELPEIVPCRI
ncbi:unnamed protein product [Allacma fusca]|uniref:Uncharacterized protein n=1 Tax=Allacma fusca TaxID=39272 RepID=A0A8J2JS16_9HEXA|nr:unnamed protein product [Allacma fusca]